MDDAYLAFLVPGAHVRNPARPDWGIGQVQSALGSRVTVSFEHAGKQVMELARASLTLVDPDDPGAP